jgi:hypothetical protein
MTKAQAAQRQQRWMAMVEARAIELRPDMRGKIDWSTAVYLYTQKMTAHDAARRLAGLPDLPRHSCHTPGANPAACPACAEAR